MEQGQSKRSFVVRAQRNIRLLQKFAQVRAQVYDCNGLSTAGRAGFNQHPIGHFAGPRHTKSHQDTALVDNCLL